MWFVKREMADCDCLMYWTTSYGGDNFCRSLNLSPDESAFTEDEGREVMSLLDDLAEAKRHISADDIDNDADADCISLWDDVSDEQWTTKDSNCGPTLAELNGGELTDLEQCEPLRIARKRKRSRSSVADASHRNTRNLVVPSQICDWNDSSSLLQTQSAKETIAVADRSANVEMGLQHDKERSTLLGEQQEEKGKSSPSKTNHKVYREFVHDTQLKTVSLPHEVKEDLQNTCSAPANHSDYDLAFGSKHPQKFDETHSAHDFHASKKMKTHHGGLYICSLNLKIIGFCVGCTMTLSLVTISFDVRWWNNILITNLF